MSLTDLVGRLAKRHRRTSITRDDGERVEVEHWHDPLLKLVREFQASGIGPGSGRSTPGFSIPLSGDVPELYARRVDEINTEYVKLRDKDHMLPEERLIAWLDWFQGGGPGAAEVLDAVEWLVGMVDEFDQLLNPPVVVEQLAQCQCGRDHVIDRVDGETVKRPALYVQFQREDVAGTSRLICRHCGPLAEGEKAVTLVLESLTKAA